MNTMFNMSRTFSDMSTVYQEGAPSEMFIQESSCSPPPSKQGKPFFKPAKNPILERLLQQDMIAVTDAQQGAQATG